MGDDLGPGEPERNDAPEEVLRLADSERFGILGAQAVPGHEVVGSGVVLASDVLPAEGVPLEPGELPREGRVGDSFVGLEIPFASGRVCHHRALCHCPLGS